MIHVLRDAGNDWMDRDGLARRIADQDLYRKQDGSPAPSDQLRLRARRYADAFECSDSRCSRIRLRDDPRAPTRQGAADAGLESEADPIEAKSHSRDPASSNGVAWYDELRERYLPPTLEVLLVAESPPDPGDRERRFFYSPVLARHDNLYRGVAEALFGTDSDFQSPGRRRSWIASVAMVSG